MKGSLEGKGRGRRGAVVAREGFEVMGEEGALPPSYLSWGK